ncbi:hypothetical protein L3Q82_021509, partial [Scortum barcoo]
GERAHDGRRPEVDGAGGGLGRRAHYMAPHIPESERSAWRPLAADSSRISQPYEDGGGGGGDDACQTGGPAGVCIPAWAHRSMEPTISQAGPGLVQPSPGPGQLGYTQDERAGDVPGSRSSQGERAGQTEEEREEEEDDLRG